MPDQLQSPPKMRDCLDCGESNGMKLQNPGMISFNYICWRCGAALTVPPPRPRV